MDHRLADGPPLKILRSLTAFTLALAVGFGPAACSPTDATPGAEARCTARCLDRAKSCAPSSCERGCRFVLDRLVEHEGASILGCVARSTAEQCAKDGTWARCAVEVGPLADGGPPPPHIPRWDEEKDDNSQ